MENQTVSAGEQPAALPVLTPPVNSTGAPAPVDAAVMTVPRSTFNAAIVGIVCFLVGMVIGAISYDRFIQANLDENQRLIDQAVAAALEARGADTADATRLVPDQRYTIETGENPSFGPDDAPVTVVEFSDFRCGFCGRFARETLASLQESYGDNIRFVYRDYVIFGQQSYEAALAAECADDQGQFWEFHNLAFENQQTMGRDQAFTIATDLGLDMDSFTTCFDNETHRDNIVGDLQYGDSLGITGTPAFFINGRFVSGAQPLETFQRIIDEELAAADDGAA